MKCKGNWICLDSRWFKQVYCFGDRLGSSCCGLHKAQRLCVESKIVDAWETSAAFGGDGVGGKDHNLCEFMDCKENCLCICFLLWKTCASCCLRGKFSSLVPESEPLQEGQGDLGHIRHVQSHQETALTLPLGPPPEGHFSGSWAPERELSQEPTSPNLSGSCTENTWREQEGFPVFQACPSRKFSLN